MARSEQCSPMSSTTEDGESGGSTRERLHIATQQTRFTLLQNILGHPQQLPSFRELALLNPTKSESTVHSHLETLVAHGIVKSVELPPGERRRDLPHTFYQLTDGGRRFLEEHGVLQAEDTLQAIYDAIDKPERLRRYESAPRP